MLIYNANDISYTNSMRVICCYKDGMDVFIFCINLEIGLKLKKRIMQTHGLGKTRVRNCIEIIKFTLKIQIHCMC